MISYLDLEDNVEQNNQRYKVEEQMKADRDTTTNMENTLLIQMGVTD